MTASIRLGDVEVGPAARQVIPAGRRLELRPRAMDLLLSFLQRPNTAISRKDLLRRIQLRLTVLEGIAAGQAEERHTVQIDPVTPHPTGGPA